MRITSTPFLLDVGATPANQRLYNDGPGTVYYKSDPSVSSTSNDGSVLSGASLAVTATQWLAAASGSPANVRLVDLGSSAAGSGVPDGGTAGQALVKNSSTDGDATWANVGGGQLYVATGSTPGDLVSGEAFFGDDGSGNLARVGCYDENTGTVKELTVSSGSSTVYGARATATIAQAISATDIIALDNELRDDGGFHSNVTNNSRMTVPASGDGWYSVNAKVAFDTTSGTRRLELLKNGATLLSRDRVITGQGEVTTTALVYLVATDYVQMQTVVSAGMNTVVNSDWSPMLSVVKVA